MSMNNNSNQRNLCKQGCGFYGTAQNMDMCSKCFQDFLKSSSDDSSKKANSLSLNDVLIQNKSPTSSFIPAHKPESSKVVTEITGNRKRCAHNDSEIIAKVPKIVENDVKSEIAEINVEENTIECKKEEFQETEICPTNSQTNFKKPRRCQMCKCKVGLTGFDCRCGGHYCAKHRYSDQHKCTFDYQAHGQEQIKTQNPMIVGSKIKKI